MRGPQTVASYQDIIYTDRLSSFVEFCIYWEAIDKLPLHSQSVSCDSWFKTVSIPFLLSYCYVTVAVTIFDEGATLFFCVLKCDQFGGIPFWLVRLLLYCIAACVDAFNVVLVTVAPPGEWTLSYYLSRQHSSMQDSEVGAPGAHQLF